MFSFTLQEIVNLVQLLGLTVIIGGTITIGALTAPVVFRSFSRMEAGSLMIELFAKFDKWLQASALLILLAKLVDVVYIHKFNFFTEIGSGEELAKVLNTNMLISSLLVIAITALSFYIVLKVSPAVLESYEADSPEFNTLHKRSELLHKVNFLLGIALLFNFAV